MKKFHFSSRFVGRRHRRGGKNSHGVPLRGVHHWGGFGPRIQPCRVTAFGCPNFRFQQMTRWELECAPPLVDDAVQQIVDMSVGWHGSARMTQGDKKNPLFPLSSADDEKTLNRQRRVLRIGSKTGAEDLPASPLRLLGPGSLRATKLSHRLWNSPSSSKNISTVL
jgi:hypothetical protein